MTYSKIQVMIEVMTIILIISIIILISQIIKYYKLKKENEKKIDNKENTNKPEETKHIQINETQEKEIIMPYRKRYLLTKNEWSFYKNLKPVADELGYTVLAKIRVADLVEVTAKDRSEWQKYFNKISKKHIDFILAKPENLQIVLLIELDDNSHNEAQKKRDDFIDELYKQTGYKFLRTRGTGELKEQIQAILKDNPIDEPTPVK